MKAALLLAHPNPQAETLDMAAQKVDRLSTLSLSWMLSEAADCRVASLGGCYHNFAS